jgi:hypothetical protein
MTRAEPFDDWPVPTLGALAVPLGGSWDSFTGQLLLLIQKADVGNRARLACAFPREVVAVEVWTAIGPATWGEIRTLVDGPG